jgi:hypothetical protein
MRKTLSPLAWSTSLNEALMRPGFANYLAGFETLLQQAGNQPDNSNQLQDQHHRG